MIKVLFHRRYTRLTGGHLKAWDYYNHVKYSPHHKPLIYFSDVIWNEQNPWSEEKGNIVDEWSIDQGDIVFLCGLDWKVLTEEQRENPVRPVINLIQHVRHADPKNERFQFLKHKAIRICVSREVSDAIKNTNQVNGSIFTIPNGVDSSRFPTEYDQKRDIDILIVGYKQPVLARRVRVSLFFGQHLFNRIVLMYKFLPRTEFLQMLGRAKVTVFMPNPTEGFYLPALEGMARETIVVCPDCVGNRSFCLNGDNCFRPEYNTRSIRKAVYNATALTPGERQRMIDRGKETVAQHSIHREREAFWEILNNISSLWATIG